MISANKKKRGAPTYKDGVYEGMRLAKDMLRNDVAYTYGFAAVILFEDGNSEDEVVEFLEKVQSRWIDVTKSGMIINDYLRDHLPFEIIQMTGEGT